MNKMSTLYHSIIAVRIELAADCPRSRALENRFLQKDYIVIGAIKNKIGEKLSVISRTIVNKSCYRVQIQ